MSEAPVLSVRGEMFLDARDDTRVLRVTRHDEAGLVVLSLWRLGTCVATFRLEESDLPAFVAALSIPREV